MKKLLKILALSTALIAGNALANPAIEISKSQQLIIDGKPFLILGGELGNSSASSLDYLSPIMKKLGKTGSNTVLVPLQWDQLEPVKGQFDYSLLDGIIKQAEENNLKIVILWFGVWKNSMSTYAPSWVKKDYNAYSRSKDNNGVSQEILSAFDVDTLNADKAAFTAMMSHLAKTDKSKTVIMVQIENEIGMLPTARDYSSEANRAYNSQVPQQLIAKLNTSEEGFELPKKLWFENGSKKSGTWSEVFGKSPFADEIFQAYGNAKFVEEIAKQSKATYNIPLYVNAALYRPNKHPGEYPSAGPLPHLFGVWKTFAPSIDILAIDIYFPNFTYFVPLYKTKNNPLFIPEANNAGNSASVGNLIFSLGAKTIGYSPFSIEDIPIDNELFKAYKFLNGGKDLILKAQAENKIHGFKADVSYENKIDETPKKITLNDIEFTINMVVQFTPREEQTIENHGVALIELAKDEYLIFGHGAILTMKSQDSLLGFEWVEEGFFQDNKFKATRVLNGDQTHQGRHLRLPGGKLTAQRFKIYRYK